MAVSLATHIGSCALRSVFMNASGVHCTTQEELKNLSANAAVGAVVSKSCTHEYRAGNPAPRYYENHLGSINSMGLPNEGYRYYADYAAAQVSRFPQVPYIVSVAALYLEENLHIISELSDIEGIAALELNLSCPNLPDKPLIAYHYENTRSLLDLVSRHCRKPLGLKLPPYFDMPDFVRYAELFSRYDIHFITSINSIPNGLIVDIESESVTIKPKNGLGGLGGAYIKPTTLANVRRFYELMPPQVAIIGCGGIENGTDVFEHILCGAAAVQIGTQLMKEGTAVFARLEKELSDCMERKGYRCIDDFKGKLKVL
ncbi:MAG: dihydroorotate oxidase [Sphingobacteriales bacterium]|nr:dihydroorotate oxidase [Sphingobacteriales bacterium]